MNSPLSRRSIRASILLLGLILTFPQRAEDPPRPVTPEEALAAIRVPAGFTVERVAGPPLVERPMLASFDDRGRLYVCDSAGVNLRGDELLKNPPHRVVRLEDSDGDGRFDRSLVFADKLVFPQGIVWHDGAVYVASPPSFWRLTDTDGDGLCDRREEVATGFANTGVADDLHGGSLGPDGRIYWCPGRFPHEIRPAPLRDSTGKSAVQPAVHKGTAPLLLRCRPDGSELEVVCGTQGNAVGAAFTPEGDVFTCGTFLAPDSMGPGLRDAIVHCVDGGVYPVRDRSLEGEHRRTGELLPPLVHLGVAAAADLTITRSDVFGREYRGNLFAAQFNYHKVTRHILERDGATFRSRNEEFLTSSHPDFHPTDVLEDADGSLLVVDTGGWFRIGCPTSQIAKPQVLGAIYRIRRTGAKSPADPRGMKIEWDDLAAEEIVRLLDDPRPAVVDHALAILARRGEDTAPALKAYRERSPDPDGRKQAVWGLSRLDGEVARAATREALADPDPGVRQAAARAVGLWRDALAITPLEAMLKSDAPSIRREAATALGRIEGTESVSSLLAALASGAEKRAGEDANGVSGNEGGEGDNRSSIRNPQSAIRNPQSTNASPTSANPAESIDRFLEHSLIFALIRIGDGTSTRAGLADTSPHARRGALIALDQMESGRLEAKEVLPLLANGEPLLRETALWIIAHRAEWGKEMAGVFRKWIASPGIDAQGKLDEKRKDELRSQLVAFAGDPQVADLIGEALGAEKTAAELRRLLLEVAAESATTRSPASWGEGIRRSLADSGADSDAGVVRQAVATARATPPAAKPVLVRSDRELNFDGARGKFAGTSLEEDFTVRWTGRLAIEKGGRQVFFLESDDGSRLFIDGKLAIDNGGHHKMSEKRGEVELPAGRHALRVELFQGGGEHGLKLSMELDGQKRVVPAAMLEELRGEYFDLAGEEVDFPAEPPVDLAPALIALARDGARPIDLRVEALAAASVAMAGGGAIQSSGPTLAVEKLAPGDFELLLSALDGAQAPLVRVTAAETLGRVPLGAEQLAALARRAAAAGALELPKLLPAFERAGTAEVGRLLVESLKASPGASGLKADALERALKNFPEEVRAGAKPILDSLRADVEAQKARLDTLRPLARGGDARQGREVFFGKKAACSTCHSIGLQGGRLAPNLTRIGAIRTPDDFLEAIVFPSASFARGYEPLLVITRDGQIHQGLKTRETAVEIHLASSATSEERIARATIREVQNGVVSIMPEGLEKQLSPTELSDLIAFLSSLK